MNSDVSQVYEKYPTCFSSKHLVVFVSSAWFLERLKMIPASVYLLRGVRSLVLEEEGAGLELAPRSPQGLAWENHVGPLPCNAMRWANMHTPRCHSCPGHLHPPWMNLFIALSLKCSRVQEDSSLGLGLRGGFASHDVG